MAGLIRVFPSNACVFIILIAACSVCTAELAVRVRTGAGNLVSQNIKENLERNSIKLSFTDFDFTKVTQLIDFQNSAQIFHIFLLGELELGQPTWVALCFVTSYSPEDFIDVEAMFKLRQKNPSVVRIADEHLGTIQLQENRRIDLSHSAAISPYISEMCSDAPYSTFTREIDLQGIAKATKQSLSSLVQATHKLTTLGLPRCSSIGQFAGNGGEVKAKPCLCQYEFSIDWYPCDLRTCRGYNEQNEVITYRCGIKSCAVTRAVEFPAPSQDMCMWE